MGSIQLVRRGHIGELDPDIRGHRGISAGPTQFRGMGVVVLDPRSLGDTGGISAVPTQLGARGY